MKNSLCNLSMVVMSLEPNLTEPTTMINELIFYAMTILLSIVGSALLIRAIWLGAKLSMTSTDEQKSKVKKQIIYLGVGFGFMAVSVVVLFLCQDPIIQWLNDVVGGNFSLR